MKVSDVLNEVKKNTKKGSKNYYKPLAPEKSKLVRDYYRITFYMPLMEMKPLNFITRAGHK